MKDEWIDELIKKMDDVDIALERSQKMRERFNASIADLRHAESELDKLDTRHIRDRR